MKYTPDGRFRQFCFIGYKTEEQAQEAISYYNNSCVQTRRIKVDLWQQNAVPIETKLKEKNNAKASQENKGSNSSEDKLDKKEDNTNAEHKVKNKQTTAEKVKEILDKHKNDPHFQEFLKVHENKWAMWSDDLGTTDNAEEEKIHEITKESKSSNSDNENKDDEKEENDDDEEVKTEKLANKPISDLEYLRVLMKESSSIDTEVKRNLKDSKSKIKGGTGCIDSNLFTIKIHNIAYRTKRQDILKFFKPLKPQSIRIPTNVRGFCYVAFKNRKDMDKAMLKNKSFIKGKQVFFSDFTEKNKITINSNLKSKAKAKEVSMTNTATGDKSLGEAESCAEVQEEIDPYRNKWQNQEKSVEKYEDIGESGCIFFRNLAYTVTEEDLEALFKKYGPLAEIHLPVDPVTYQIKGFGTVTYLMPEHAVQAFNELDGTTFHGRLLHLIPGKNWTHGDGEDDEGAAAGKLSFKQKKARALKESAQQSYNWNTLFLGPNAVANLMASKYKMDKEQILDMQSGGSSGAVRLALGETYIVTELRRFLEENQVCLEAFSGDHSSENTALKRSKNIILVKNLPSETTSEELLNLFRPFGTISRLILPPQGVTAIVEFTVSFEANKAFKRLAYSQFKSLPLYLEWAPVNTFRDKKETLSESKDTDSIEGNTKVKNEDTVVKKTKVKEEMPINGTKEEKLEADLNKKLEDAEEEETENPPEENTTLFIRNLNFKTVKSGIRDHFCSIGPIHAIEIAQRRDKQNPQEKVSLGYGFIQFKRRAAADQALKTKQFSTLDGNTIELKRSEKILK